MTAKAQSETESIGFGATTLPKLLMLLIVLCAAFLPTLRNGFVWDDNRYVTDNPTLREPDALRRIWLSPPTWADPVATPSPYPLSLTLFLAEFRAFGESPAGYHAVSLAMHAANALLLWWLLARAGMRAAWLAAVIFAVHPVQVETVAWIAEQKNLLSTLGGLLFLHAFLSHLRSGRWPVFAAALACFLLALLAKTVASTFAASAVLLWLNERARGTVAAGPGSWRGLAARLAPLLVLGFAFAVVTILWERTQTGATDELVALTAPGRIRIAARAPWFYLLKGLWPMDLMAVYPKWDTLAAGALAWGFISLTAACGVLALRGLVAGARPAALCAAHFLASIAPVLGFFNFSTMLYSFAADHYQYVAAVGWMIPLAWLLDGLSARAHDRWIGRALNVLAVLLLAFLSHAESRHYRGMDSLFQRCLEKNPSAWIAHYNLGHSLLASGRADEALPEYEACLRLNPGYAPAHNGIGAVLFNSGDPVAARDHFRRALELDLRFGDAMLNLVSCLVELAGRTLDSAEPAAAEPLITEALSINPADADALFYLGRLRLLQKRPAEAVPPLEQAAAVAPGDAEIRAELDKARRAAGMLR